MMRAVSDNHLLGIARKTLKLNCFGARVMGGPNHAEAVRILARFGIRAAKPAGCTCEG